MMLFRCGGYEEPLGFRTRLVLFLPWSDAFTTDSASAGRVMGILGFGGFFLFSLDSEEVMGISKNGERVLDLLWKNYEEQNEVNKRIKDRVIVVIGSTVTAIGLIASIQSEKFANWYSSAIYIGSVVAILAAFAFGSLVFKPRYGSQPSSSDPQKLWDDLVKVDEIASLANLISDLCKAIEATRKESVELATRFNWCLTLCEISLALAVLSNALIVVSWK